MATLRSCAPCTRPMATGTRSLGHDTLARAIAKMEKPAITPWRTRRIRSWGDRGDEPHRGHDDHEADERADHHHLAADPVREAAPERAQQPRDRAGHRGEHPRPEG